MSLSKIGRYEIRGELGRGAMGVVYRAYDPNIDREVAVKTIHIDLQDTEVVERFRREARTAGNLSHPNIVLIYDAGEDNGLFYIAMELVEGETLQEILARGPLPVEQVIAIVEQIAAALDYAHARKVVHRDIKPANIMLTAGQVKVTDFGLAKVTSSMATATKIVGTPSYMSPEQITSGSLDGRSDIFSLGAMFYEMLTGARPFQGDNIPVVMFKVMREEPAPPTVVNPAIPPGLNYIVVKALAKEPAQRYQNCRELMEHLRNYQALGAMKTPVPGGVPSGDVAVPVASPKPATQSKGPKTAPILPARQWIQGQWKAVALGVAGLAFLLLGVVLYWQSGPSNGPGSGVPAEPAVAPGPAAPPSAGEGGAVPGVRPTEPRPASPPPAARPSPPPPPAAGTRARETGPTPAREPPASPSRPSGSPSRFTPPPAGLIGRVSVHSQPQGARIFVNDAETPYRTPVNFALAPGTYRLTLERNGYERATREIVVRQDQTVSLQLELQREEGRRSR